MSVFEEEMCVDMSSIPTKCLEKAYWRRKLPSAFRFYLEMLARELMLSQPANSNAHAAGFFEELLIQRDTELSLLPYLPYLNKLKGMAAGGTQQQQQKQAEQDASQLPVGPHTCVKCARCGRQLKDNPATAPGATCAEMGGPGATRGPGATGAPGAPPAGEEDVRSCSRCGREVVIGPGGTVVRSRSPSPAGFGRMEVEGDCRVVTLPQAKRDAFNRLPMRREGKDGQEEDLVTCRALAIIVDY